MDAIESPYANSALLVSWADSQCETFQMSATANTSSKLQRTWIFSTYTVSSTSSGLSSMLHIASVYAYQEIHLLLI